jgi:hypothetical protein
MQYNDPLVGGYCLTWLINTESIAPTYIVASLNFYYFIFHDEVEVSR